MRSIESERGIWRTPRGEVGGQCLILIKRARLIVSGNPVCHGRYAEESLWHRPTYGPACCLPIQPPSTCSPQLDWFPGPRLLGAGPLASTEWSPLSANGTPHAQACRLQKGAALFRGPEEGRGEKGGCGGEQDGAEGGGGIQTPGSAVKDYRLRRGLRAEKYNYKK